MRKFLDLCTKRLDWIRIFTATWFVITKKKETFRWPSTRGWINKPRVFL